MTEQQQITEERQNQYFALVDELLRCPNGQEPEVLKTHAELIDADLVRIILRVATVFAHDGNQEGAEFLIHIARELSKELGLYPDISQGQEK